MTTMVVFDFDGTITRAVHGRTTWEMIWDHLGYARDECAQHHARYRAGTLTHTDWCKLTLEKFRERRLKRADLASIARRLELHERFPELLGEFERRGIVLHIVSGSIGVLIRDVLGPDAARFATIKANEMEFGADGVISDIVETQYDFEGKADYLTHLVANAKCAAADVLFVGNAGNDRWVADAGVRTLCVNPVATDPDDRKAWTASIREMRDMREILTHV